MQQTASGNGNEIIWGGFWGPAFSGMKETVL